MEGRGERIGRKFLTLLKDMTSYDLFRRIVLNMKLFFPSGVMVNDGKWHQVKVTSNSTHTKVMVGGVSVVESVSVLGGSWPDFVKNEPVIVGRGKAGMATLKGCLQNVKVGGWLLPFVDYYNQSMNVSDMSPLEPNFKGALSDVTLGCHGDSVCFPDPCVRGSCDDIWNDYQCYCPSGYAGLSILKIPLL